MKDKSNYVWVVESRYCTNGGRWLACDKLFYTRQDARDSANTRGDMLFGIFEYRVRKYVRQDD